MGGLLPTFIGLGSQRCGSTWVDSILRLHPQVFMSSPKELKYFSQHAITKDLDWYRHKFSCPPGYLARGEITPMYVRLPEAGVKFVRSVVPSVKIFLTMRNPAVRAWSQLQYELGHLAGRDVEELSRSAIFSHLLRRRSIVYGDYANIFKRWASVFGEERLLFGTYEELCQDPRGYLRQIFCHIGVDTEFAGTIGGLDRRVHSTEELAGKNLGIPSDIRWFLARLWLPRVGEMRVQFGDRVLGWERELQSWLEDCEDPPSEVLRVLSRIRGLPERLVHGVFDGSRRRLLSRRYRVLARA